MNPNSYTALQHLLKNQHWNKSLKKVDQLLEENPLAIQLYLLKAQIVQLQDENIEYSLNDAEKALKKAVEIDNTYFDAIVELMHFYDIVSPDTSKAVKYAKKVKEVAQKALSEADTILEEHQET